MKRSKLIVGALALVPSMGFLAVTQLADAHHPDIDAAVVCNEATNKADVTITVTSWNTDEAARRVNNNIAVLWDNGQIATGQFTPGNNYTFKVTFSLPPDSSTHTAKATAVAPFGANGEFGFEGSFRDVTVKLPAPCEPVTPAAPVTPVVVATTVPTEVLGTTVTRPADVAVPVEVLPRFAG